MPGPSVSHISQAYPDRVEVRGRDLTGDLMGRLTFTEYFHLLLTGDEPTEEQREFLDLLLVAIAEHGMMPTNVAARMTLAADPGALQGAVAAGILGAGPVLLGTSEECAKLLGAALARGGDPHAAGAAAAAEIRAAGGRVPGFGHPVHTPLDPRAERILELADARGVAGPHVAMARAIRDGVAAAWGRPLTMNVSMPIAAVLLDLGFDARTVKAIPILARTASLLAHLAEERDEPIGLPDGVGRRARRHLRAPGMSGLREQLAYLLERSAFYREKLAGHDVGGELAALPLTTKQELRATVSRDWPMGTHVCVPRAEIARIYSTSGTTGTPSYIPLTAGDVENWVTGSGPQLRDVGRAAGRADRLDLQRRPVRGRRRARRLRPHRPLPHPRGHRQHGAAGPGDRAARAGGGGDDAVLRGVRARVGRPSATSTSPPPRCGACSSRASPAAASRRSAHGWSRAGARASPRRWGSATSACRCGASARRRTGCTWARRSSSSPS